MAFTGWIWQVGSVQRLFRRLGLVPGPDFDAHAAASLDGTSLDQARRHLGELYDQNLITEPAPGRFSTTTDLPSRSDRCGATARQSASTAPPAGHGAIKVICRAG